ncbi:hypothetical protein K466DRAFT_570218 [Polyporus arcularius HHB13444]|uniref:Uncharacterized protein n=1 Tax=Polyporus arcularius HHB13444 TaxID=1314778 RepID=A0A5C3NST5_9APHY|nr:hypothetical protein K466DRAFT_570218 [Polyporus arcularius HHB13444]
MADATDSNPPAPASDTHPLELLETPTQRPPSVPLNRPQTSNAARPTGYNPPPTPNPLAAASSAESGAPTPHVAAETLPLSPFQFHCNPPPSTKMGSSFSSMLHDDKFTSPTPQSRNLFSFNTAPKPNMGTEVNQLGAGIPYFATTLVNGKRPYKRQRSLSSPSPPRDLLAHQFPARENPGTILTTGPEGSTLADSLYGPQTAHATMDAKQVRPQLVSSREYNERVHWKAATIYKNETGVETFEYPKFTPGEAIVDPPPPQSQTNQNEQHATHRLPGSGGYAQETGRGVAENAQLPPMNPETWQSLTQEDEAMMEADNANMPGTYNDENRPPLLASARALFPSAFSLPGLLPATNPPSAPQAAPAFPMRKWNLTEAERAVQQTPGHPYRRRIKSPAPDVNNRLFRTDYYTDMKQNPMLDPMQPTPNPAVARARTQIAQEVLPTTLIPPPPRPFPGTFPQPTSWQAMDMVNVRPPLDEESMMRMPPEGGPRIHNDSAWGPFRGLAKTRVGYILNLPKDRTVKYTVWGSPSATSDPIDVLYGRAQSLISRFLKGATNFRIIAPESEWGRRVAPNALNAPGAWIASELTPAQATALVDQHCLSTPEITIFCTRITLENPQFLFRAGNFISKDPDLILETLRHAFVEPNMRARITALLRQNPNYAGMDAEHAFLRFLTTIEMDIKEVPTSGMFSRTDTVVAVYCDPPTLNPERWLEWARDFRAMKLQHPQFLNSANVLPPIRCSGCHSVDHYLDQCEWPEMSDWRAPLPNSSTANSVFDWFSYNRSSTPTDRAGPSNSRPHDDSYSRRGGRGNAGGRGGFGRGAGRGQGATAAPPECALGTVILLWIVAVPLL